jgi:hypothetical protein
MDSSLLELTLPPDWDAVRVVWSACHRMLSRSGLGDDEAYALSMVAQELLENAVKYGASGAEVIRLLVRVADEDVTVEVRSQVDGDARSLEAFGGVVGRLRAAPDPYEAYVERLRLVAAGADAGGASELGLARIAYEGRCALDFRVDEGILAVSAVYRRREEAVR